MMRILTLSFILLTTIIFIQPAFAFVNLKIEGKEAKKIYVSLTGPAVQQQGAAGHIYRQGKSILCRYTDADMDDNQGNPIPQDDSRRYACSMKFNINGLATPGNNP